MKIIYFLFLSLIIFPSCSTCYQCSFKYYLTAADQATGDITKAISFDTGVKNCSKNYLNDIQEFYMSKEFRIQNSLKCKKSNG